METAILPVMVSLAALGFGMMGLIWRALDGRMDRIDDRLGRIENHLDRIEAGQGDHGQRIARLEGREEALAGT